MSTLSLVTTECTRCGASCDAEVVVVANFDRRPDLRQAVLDGSFNRIPCGACGNTMVVQRGVGVWDWDRKQYLNVWPTWAETHWRDLARSTADALHRNLGLAAPPAMRDAAHAFTVRTVFGYDQLREKLVIWDAGLDEIRVESAKLGLLSNRPDRARAHVWLWEVTDRHLRFVMAGAGAGVERVETDHGVLDLPLPGDLSPLDLQADPYVNFRRWLVKPTPANPLDFDLHGISQPHAGGAALREPFDDRT